MADYINRKSVEPAPNQKWLISRKHCWKRDKYGDIDLFAGVDVGYHNGPLCVKCGLSFCEHCEPDLWESECDVPTFVCSSCGIGQEKQTNYCPNCGAKMDGGDDDATD